jgi:repressor LexA
MKTKKRVLPPKKAGGASQSSASQSSTSQSSTAQLSSTESPAESFKSSTLAPVQRQTLEFLRNFLAENGYGPTLKDIARHIGVKSLSTAHFHLERLENKGFIRRGEDGMIELIDISTPQLAPTSVPLVGTIAAGLPIEAIENTTMVEIPASMIDGRGEVYCLEVSGDSMIDAHICDGDLVVIKKQDVAENGQIVVALLEDGSATLKTYRRLKSGKVMLIPANASMNPMTLDDVSVQGRLIGVIRELH